MCRAAVILASGLLNLGEYLEVAGYDLRKHAIKLHESCRAALSRATAPEFFIIS